MCLSVLLEWSQHLHHRDEQLVGKLSGCIQTNCSGMQPGRCWAPWLAASKAFKHMLCLVFSNCYQSCTLISFPIATGEGYLSSQSSAIHLPATPQPVPQGCLPGHRIQLLGSGIATSAQVNWLQSFPSLLSSWAGPGCVSDAQTPFVNHIPSFHMSLLAIKLHRSYFLTTLSS